MAQNYTILVPPDPALTPPPGIIPDFQDPFTLRPYWIVTTALGLLGSGFFLALRLYTKIAVVKRLRWEDCRLPPSDSIVSTADCRETPVRSDL